MPNFEQKEQGPDFEAVIEKLPAGPSRVLLAVLIRDMIFDKDEFKHIIGIEGEELEINLAETIKQGLIHETEIGKGERKQKVWTLTDAFREYWNKTKDEEAR